MVRDWTRVETWRFFEPPNGGGNNDYAFVATRLFGSVQRTAPAYDLTAALQYVQFGGLPSDAVGPGPLGTGAVYYAHAGCSDSHQVYLRYANVRFKRLVPHTTIQVGRMPYASGGEAASANPKIEAVRAQRIAARVIGEFGWSIYQRAYDGVRVDTASRRWTATGFAFHPTQGGFEDDRHGTFFAMLPTVRQYAQSALYSQMNNTDLFAQLLARPRTNMKVRLDWHRVDLATSSDGWYYGSGATQEHGTIFGCATRPSFGATHLATIGEGSVDYAIAPHWSVNGYLAVARAGGVVKPAFAGHTLTFAYLENVLQF